MCLICAIKVDNFDGFSFDCDTGPKDWMVEQTRGSYSHVAQEMVCSNWRSTLLLQDSAGISFSVLTVSLYTSCMSLVYMSIVQFLFCAASLVALAVIGYSRFGLGN